jgi:hypothetical protein
MGIGGADLDAESIVYFVDDLPLKTSRRTLTVREILEQACVLGADVEDARLILVELRGGLRIRYRNPRDQVELRNRQHFVTAQDL